MSKFFRIYVRLLCLSCLCVIMFGCEDILPYTPPTYSCMWTSGDWVAQFANVSMELPGVECDFNNTSLNLIFPYTSCYDLQYDAENRGLQYSISGWYSSWETSVYGKTCQDPDVQLVTQYWQPNNFPTHLTYTWDYRDFIENPHSLISGYGVDTTDLMHKLTIQLYGVENTWNGSTGTLTWTKTWLGFRSSDFIHNEYVWVFYLPYHGWKATFTPYSNYSREIYVHDQFELFN